MHWDESAEELAAEDLNNDDDGPDDDECRVREDSLEDVEFILDLSGANHIENLHEYEQVEDDSQVARWSFRLKSFVHWFLFRVLLHSVKNVEVSLVPIFFKALVVFWVLSFKLSLHCLESD